mgnify:FL=1|jgi:hypothetical protein|tara:strand:- start:1738 stop:2403 length:666 start_codon:yes stop_codon:yes gene_type:complete
MTAKFKKKKYVVVKNAISPEVSDFLYKYFLLKRQVARTMFKERFISPFTTHFGAWNDPQVINTYSHYSDIAMETLLTQLLPKVSKITGFKLAPNYSYARIYKKGDILHRHKDRFSCEVSTTLFLGGDNWPIFIDPTGSNNVTDESKNTIRPDAPKGRQVNLNPGDMLVYSGCELEHWREAFDGKDCGQVFLHYNNTETPGADKNLYDKRPHLGLPSDFKKP